MSKDIKVLDKGFVKYIDHMGSDLSVVNAARVSFGKQKEVFDEKDEKLIKYLIEHEHTSPLRHAYMTFHVKAPIFVFRQWVKHKIGSDINEISMRYVEITESDYYVPSIFRQQSTNNKQGSTGEISPENKEIALLSYVNSCESSLTTYKQLLQSGVCREQARCVLPVSMYSEIYWTVSLQAAAHFVKLRTESHAQWEIQQYGNAIKEIVEDLYPISSKYLLTLN